MENLEPLDVVKPIVGGEILTVISIERGLTPEQYYCVDENGNGDWFTANELRVATTNDIDIKERPRH